VTGSVEIRQLDVSDLGSIRAFVDATEGPVDVLVNNAGVMDIPAQRTADGFDLQTASNYFGPFVLTNLLADRVTDRHCGAHRRRRPIRSRLTPQATSISAPARHRLTS
jgi:NAD(P)-dependent dehydrogenase (short-subunit alcohol dehydrogenase family)